MQGFRQARDARPAPGKNPGHGCASPERSEALQCSCTAAQIATQRQNHGASHHRITARHAHRHAVAAHDLTTDRQSTGLWAKLLSRACFCFWCRQSPCVCMWAWAPSQIKGWACGRRVPFLSHVMAKPLMRMACDNSAEIVTPDPRGERQAIDGARRSGTPPRPGRSPGPSSGFTSKNGCLIPLSLSA